MDESEHSSKVFSTETDHWYSRVIDFVIPRFKSASHLIRISTGFFTIEGYDLIRGYLSGKRVCLLVGYDETSKERLRQKLIDDVMAHLSLWSAGNRREAVKDLVEKLRNGEFALVESQGEEGVDTRIRNKDHAKIYIIDEDCVLLGSSNLTFSGLRLNTEGLGIVDTPERVENWIKWYEAYWKAKDTQDLTQELLDALLKWLGLNIPYDIYLKTLLALDPEEEPEPPRPSYKVPVKYQRVVIARMLRQLRDWHGAMLVASTGLGKTIMATHLALLMQKAGEIKNVIVFSPVQIQPDWDNAFYSAGINARIFTRNLLDQPNTPNRNNRKVKEIDSALDGVDGKCLIIVDESQHFTNKLRAKDGKLRHSFRRLLEAAEQKKPYVVLLTATPFVKGVEDLNNQLLLLPHEAPPSNILPSRQMAMENIGDHLVEKGIWQVLEHESFEQSFREFMELQVCTVISTSQVAKDFSVSTEAGDYVEFGDEQRWLPQIEVMKISVPISFEEEMSEALNNGYFKHKMHRFKARGKWRFSESNIEEEARTAWSSSPLALQEVLKNTIEGNYDVQFTRSTEARKELLIPILKKAQNQKVNDDLKLKALHHLVKVLYEQQQKVIIFTERRATAYYLEQNLPKLLPTIKVACVVKKTQDGYELKDFDKEVFQLMVDFAPEANRDKLPANHKPKHYDVFITTDAYGVGVNLQDATSVISYDLAWTPDVIIQRAGRILRFWKRPRKVFLYVFINEFTKDIEGQRAAEKIKARLHRLTDRTRKAEHFSEMPVIPEGERSVFTSLGDLSSVTIEDLGIADITEIEEFSGVSPFLIHLTELNHNLQYAKSIPDDISSAMIYKGKKHLIYLLLKHKRAYSWSFYDIERKSIYEPKEDELLNIIRCGKEEQTAQVEADYIEEQAQLAKTKWCHAHKVPEADLVERICALYLVPLHGENDIEHLVHLK